jgi:hypothetical protein
MAFQLNLIIVGTIPRVEHLKGSNLSLDRLSWTNTLASYKNSQIMTVKSFIRLSANGACSLKLFTVIIVAVSY